MDALPIGLHEQMDGEDFPELRDTPFWTFHDNGAEILVTCREWLEGDDVRRVEIALPVDHGRLFRTLDDMESAFDALVARCRQFREATRSTVDERMADRKPGADREALRTPWPVADTARIFGITEERLRRRVEESG